jgi:DNA-binding response OmpR family regulator
MDKKNKILIVDDEEYIVKALSDHLGRKGYETITASNGEEGLSAAEKSMPDLILLDIIMPKMDGITMLRELKKNSKTESIPVIMITNLDNKESDMEANELGVAAYLVKTDYGLEEITKKIEEILNC